MQANGAETQGGGDAACDPALIVNAPLVYHHPISLPRGLHGLHCVNIYGSAIVCR